MRAIVIGVATALAFAGTAAANQCYERVYSDAHMARNPEQTVEMLQVFFITEGDLFAKARARFRGDPELHQTDLICWEGQGDYALTCGVECDGGRFTTVLDGADAILLRTGGFLVSADCGEEDLRWVRDEGVDETVFKLFRQSEARCYEAAQ